MDLAQIDEIFELMGKLEGKIPGPKVQEWIDSIAEPEYGLVSSLVKNFFNEKSTYTEKFLRILRVFCQFSPEKVGPQLDNEEFKEALKRYLEKKETEEVSYDAFIILAQQEDLDCSLALAKQCFDSLEYLQDELACKAVLSILVRIFIHDQQIMVQCCNQHKNARHFGEILLHMINRSEDKLLEDCLECIKNLLKCEDTMDTFFYTNDLKTLCDIVLSHLSTLSDEELVKPLLEVMLALLENPSFFAMEHRVSDIKEVVATFEAPSLTIVTEEILNAMI